MSNRTILPKSPEVAAHQDAVLKTLAHDLKHLARKARKAGLKHIADQIKRVG